MAYDLPSGLPLVRCSTAVVFEQFWLLTDTHEQPTNSSNAARLTFYLQMMKLLSMKACGCGEECEPIKRVTKHLQMRKRMTM
jgi:hypothetical protein